MRESTMLRKAIEDQEKEHNKYWEEREKKKAKKK